MPPPRSRKGAAGAATAEPGGPKAQLPSAKPSSGTTKGTGQLAKMTGKLVPATGDHAWTAVIEVHLISQEQVMYHSAHGNILKEKPRRCAPGACVCTRRGRMISMPLLSRHHAMAVASTLDLVGQFL
jgi:hypothetical protein